MLSNSMMYNIKTHITVNMHDILTTYYCDYLFVYTFKYMYETLYASISPYQPLNRYLQEHTYTSIHTFICILIYYLNHISVSSITYPVNAHNHIFSTNIIYIQHKMILSFIIDLQIEFVLIYISSQYKLLNMYVYFNIILCNIIRHVTVTMIATLATNMYELLFNNMLLNVQQDLYYFPTVVLN